MYSKTILIGRLTADPERKTTPQGTSLCNFRIAVDRAYKDGDGNVSEGNSSYYQYI